MEKKKSIEISVLTTFFCICVILIHLTAQPIEKLAEGSWQRAFFFLWNKSLSFVVPGFIFLSGFKLMLSQNGRVFHWRAFLWKRLKKIALPYLCWYLIYYRYFVQHGFMQAKTGVEHMFSFCMGTMVSPFYFITIIVQFYLLFGIIIQLFQRIGHKRLLGASFLLQAVYLKLPGFPYEDRIFLTYQFYFLLGCFAALHLREMLAWLQKRWIAVGLGYLSLTAFYCIGAYAAASRGTFFPFARIWAFLFSVSAILFYFLLADRGSPRRSALWQWVFFTIDSASYYIFLSHCYLIYYCNDQWFLWGKTSIVDRFVYTAEVLFPVVFFACTSYVLMKEKVRYYMGQGRNGEREERKSR